MQAQQIFFAPTPTLSESERLFEVAGVVGPADALALDANVAASEEAVCQITVTGISTSPVGIPTLEDAVAFDLDNASVLDAIVADSEEAVCQITDTGTLAFVGVPMFEVAGADDLVADDRRLGLVTTRAAHGRGGRHRQGTLNLRRKHP